MAFLSGSGEVSRYRQIRPTRIAILHGSKLESRLSNEEYHRSLVQLFSPLNVRIFSVLEMTQAGMSDLVSSKEYDVIGLIGEPKEFDFTRKFSGRFKKNVDEDSIVLSFAPNTYFKHAKAYLQVSDAIILCEDLPNQISKVVFHFFESLVVPSMLNIDLADVRSIAKGIGLAFNLSNDSSRKIIASLPKSCLVARSALLHFSCSEDVRLKEVYSISKAIALKKGLPDMQINTHAEAKKLIRKVNVKMGIRIKDPSENVNEKRISMTAILFGL